MKFFKYECPLTNPISINGITIHKREWIEIESNEKKVALAPLPGLHTESLEESYKDFIDKTFKTPSALFAKQALELDINSPREVSINKLDFLDPNKPIYDYYKQWKDKDIVKLKIGRNPLEIENKILKDLLAKNNKSIEFRLDANKSLSLSDLSALLEEVDLKSIQYLEEPLKDINEWSRYERRNEIALALDENVPNRSKYNEAQYLVVKPTYNLSLEETLKEIELENFKVVISSSFDPIVNIEILKKLSSLTNQSAGLDTLKYFDLSNIKKYPL
jgi:O-succinylbenzoate synthase